MNSIAWTSDRRILISGGDDGVIKVGERRRRHVVMERGEGRVGIRLLSHMAEVNQVLPSKTDASKFFSCSNDKTVKVFDISTAAALHSFSDHE